MQTQTSAHTHTHTHTHLTYSYLKYSVSVVNTFTSVIIVVGVLKFQALCSDFYSWCCQTLWSALCVSLCLPTSRTLVSVCFCPLWHCSAGPQFVWHRQVLFQPESRSTCFYYRFKIQLLHNVSYRWARLIPAEALSCQSLKDVALNSCCLFQTRDMGTC